MKTPLLKCSKLYNFAELPEFDIVLNIVNLENKCTSFPTFNWLLAVSKLEAGKSKFNERMLFMFLCFVPICPYRTL